MPPDAAARAELNEYSQRVAELSLQAVGRTVGSRFTV
jgi:hypothetical protein